MKKIALTIAAVATLGLAACNGASDEVANDTNTAVTDMDATTDAALTDVNGAATDAAAMNAADAALDNAAAAAENTVDAVETAADAVEANAQ